MRLRNEPQLVKMEGEGDQDVVSKLRMLIGTSGGLIYFNGYQPHRITNREYLYGITRRTESEWWLANRNGSFIYKIEFTDKMTPVSFDLIADLRMAGVAEHMGFHQIDFINDELAICDTYNNRVLCGLCDTKKLLITKMIYPVGYHNLTDSRSRNPRYKHFNSVYRVGDYIYMIAHNETSKTSVRSQLFMFDKGWNLRHIVEDVGGCAHNIAVDFNQRMYMCNSVGHSLVTYDGVGVTPVFSDTRFKSFTRGLAINDDVVVMGGSLRGGAVVNHKKDGLLFVLDANTHVLLATLKLEGAGQIYEVRFTGLDYGLSNTWRKHGT